MTSYDDEGLDDDTDDESCGNPHPEWCDCLTCSRMALDDDDEGLDEDDTHAADCCCESCCEAQLIGLVTVGGDDPEGYLAARGLDGLADVGRAVALDDDGPWTHDRSPECDWCGGKGCATCDDPHFTGVEP